MTEEESSELYVCLAFQYESAIEMLLAKGVIDTDFVSVVKGKFYDYLSLKRYSAYSSQNYIIDSGDRYGNE